MAKRKNELFSLFLDKNGFLRVKLNLHPAQRDVFEAQEPIVVFSSGTGAGKTALGTLLTIVSLHRAVRNGRIPAQLVVASPTYTLQSRTTKRYLQRLLDLELPRIYGVRRIGDWYKKDNFFEFNDVIKVKTDSGFETLEGSRIYFLHLQNPNALEGIHVDAIWADEMFMPKVSEDVWKVMLDRRRMSEGKIFITSTPYKHDNMWAHEQIIIPGQKIVYIVDHDKIQQATTEDGKFLDWRKLERIGGLHRIVKRGKDPEIVIVQAPSILNPNYPIKQYLEGIKKWGEDVGHARFDGNWDGIIFAHGKLFWAFNPRKHVIEEFDIPQDWIRIIGVDVGIREPTAAVWIAISPSNEAYVYKTYEAEDPRPKTHGYHIATISQGEHIHAIYIDPSFSMNPDRWDPHDFVEGLKEGGINLNPLVGNNSRWDTVDAINAMFEGGRMFVLDRKGIYGTEKLRRKLASFSRALYVSKKRGKRSIDDHLIDALRYAATYIYYNNLHVVERQHPNEPIDSPAHKLPLYVMIRDRRVRQLFNGRRKVWSIR